MKKLIFLLTFSSLILAGALSLPKPTGFVTDNAGMLSSETKSQLESELTTFASSTSHEIAVVTIPKLENDTIETAAESLFKEWGIGKAKADNGVLFLISRDDREMRIEVGYGLEGALPDATAFAIINETKTYFQSGDYDGGVKYAVSQIEKATEGEKVDIPTQKENISGFLSSSPVIWFIFFFLFGILKFLARSKAWWHGGVIGAVVGIIGGAIFGGLILGLTLGGIFAVVGLILDYLLSKSGWTGGGPSVWYPGSGGFGRGGFGGGSSGGGFGGFGGGSSGGGGASGKW